KTKKDLYAEAGVLEYWVLDYTHETVARFNLEGENTYGRPLIFVSDEPLTSVIFPDFTIDLSELFPVLENGAGAG
ncbi:MAG TPA: Uma2 family endonuclease, partial [Actinomycetota bacterium]|nr:Uma2 family endonuclease [Actinomycetota bacterium]